MTRPPHLWELDYDPASVECADPPGWLTEKRRQNRSNGRAEKLPPVIRDGAWHDTMVSAAGSLRARGFTEQAAVAALLEQNATYDGTAVDDGSEIRALVADVYERYPADRDVDVRREYDGPPRPIDDVLTTFRRWLHLPDPGPVMVTCAVIAANRVVSFDPTWLILVGAAGSGKTEALSATSELDGVHVVATLTEAGLLSGTPRKDTAAGASGGLLREIGEHGIIVLKDFGSILSMHHDARAAVLAALREVFDGNWTRLVGVDGGRRLHWQGRIGLLAGATTVLDQHHAVMAQLGERFLIHRVIVDDASKQGHSSLAHHGRERGMRQELADAVAGLFAGLDLSNPPALSTADTERLVSLAVLVSRARSPVVRDSYRREIELVPDSEAPGRVVGALARLLTGLRLIGASESDAWRLTVKTGLDSMPAARRRALEFLLAHDAPTTTDVATALGLPNPTAHRILEDLAAHDVIARDSQGQGKADLWRIEPRTVKLYGEATSSEKSGNLISNDSDYTYDDFSEEVDK